MVNVHDAGSNKMRPVRAPHAVTLSPPPNGKAAATFDLTHQRGTRSAGGNLRGGAVESDWKKSELNSVNLSDHSWLFVRVGADVNAPLQVKGNQLRFSLVRIFTWNRVIRCTRHLLSTCSPHVGAHSEHRFFFLLSFLFFQVNALTGAVMWQSDPAFGEALQSALVSLQGVTKLRLEVPYLHWLRLAPFRLMRARVFVRKILLCEGAV